MGRVVVTGLGPVSSVGIGTAEFTEALKEGRSGISRIESFDPTGFPYVNAGEVRDFEPKELLHRLDPTDWGRSSQFVAAAARLAVADADLDLSALPADRAGAAVGTTSGESQVVEELTARLVAEGYEAFTADLVRQQPANRLAHAVSDELGFEGESVTIATACSASNYALAYGYDLVAAGEADVMVVGGADSMCRWAHAGFYRLGAMTEHACAPFDRDRSGILIGEGGAALVLESLDHALARGARVYAEVLGYGLNCDANHITTPYAPSVAECMRMAHRSAGIRPEDVDYICAHGTGTRANDSIEGQAILEVFGPTPPPVSSIKSMIGHAMGAASAFGAIASVLAIHDGFIPPTLNWRNPDPEIAGIDPVPNVARTQPVRVVQNDGFAFGGNNAITILGAFA